MALGRALSEVRAKGSLKHPFARGGDDWLGEAELFGEMWGLLGKLKSMPAVWGCMNLIANTVASLPVYLEVGGKRVTAAVPPFANDQLLVAADSALQPSWRETVKGMVTSVLGDGNLFLHGVAPGGRLVEVEVLDPQACTYDVHRRPGRLTVLHNGVELAGVTTATRYHTVPGQHRGVGPVDAASRLIRAGREAERSAYAMWRQGGLSPGVIKLGADASPESLKEVRRDWLEWHAGVANHHLPFVLGDADWQNISMSPEAMQFLNVRQWTSAEIAGFVFHIDPSRFGIPLRGATTLTYGNLSQRNAQFFQDAIQPVLDLLEAAMSPFMPAGEMIRFDGAKWLRPEPKARAEYYFKLAQTGKLLNKPVITAEEIRELEGFGELPAGYSFEVDSGPNPVPIVELPPGDDPDDDPDSGERGDVVPDTLPDWMQLQVTLDAVERAEHEQAQRYGLSR